MRLPVFLLVPALLAAGCTQSLSLKPAPAASTVPTPGPGVAAVDDVSGVRVAVVPRAWPGDIQISSAVTPVKVRIDNNSNDRVLVRYSEIVLTAPDGQTYAALPPYRIDASVYEPRLMPGYAPVTAPGIAGRGFAIAPLYAPLYPGLPTATGGFFYDPFYYSHFGDYWRNVELPTPAMLQRALPEGSISAGGSVEGFLYFQKVDADVPRVRFRMDLLNAARGGVMGTAEIPLIVSS
jgi:hypothetical protein